MPKSVRFGIATARVFTSNYQFLSKRVCFSMIFVIDDDDIMAECIGRAITDAGKKEFRIFSKVRNCYV